MCEVLAVSRSGYYRWRKAEGGGGGGAAAHELDALIAKAFEDSRQTYGSPRLTLALRRQGHAVSESTVARRMRVLGLRPGTKKRFVRTTRSGHDHPVAPNLLDRNFTAAAPNEKWVSDLTYFAVDHRWAYLTTIIDLFDRRIVAWVVSDTMRAEATTIAALQKAVRHHRPPAGLLFHSDRGVQYARGAFRELLGAHAMVQSMSRKGDCYDNAVAESGFKTIKTECLHRYTFDTLEQARWVLFDYIDGWYNTLRIHTSLGGLSPDQLRQQLNAA